MTSMEFQMALGKNHVEIATPIPKTSTRRVLSHDTFKIKTVLRCWSHPLGMTVVRSAVEAVHLFHRVKCSSKWAILILSSRLAHYRKLCLSHTKKLSQLKPNKLNPTSKKRRQRADSKMLCQYKHKIRPHKTRNGSKKQTLSSSRSKKIELNSKTHFLKSVR